MLVLLLDCAVRSVLIASVAATVLWALRLKAALVRHRAWTAVLIGMLVLPLWSVVGPRLSVRVLWPTPELGTLASVLPDRVLSEAPTSDATLVKTRPDVTVPLHRPSVPVGLYWLGVLVLMTRLALGTRSAWTLRRQAVAVSGRMTSPDCTTPITIGLLKPRLVLPEGWQTWPVAKLNAVLTHEAEHARRRDPLVQWFALLNCTIFWFHPLAWWLERHLVSLAEGACDSAVLAAGHLPEDYSEYLLDFARSVTDNGGRVRLGAAMRGQGLPGRLRRILTGIPDPPVSRVRALCAIMPVVAMSGLLASATLTTQEASLTAARVPFGSSGPLSPEEVVPTWIGRPPGTAGAPGATQIEDAPAPPETEQWEPPLNSGPRERVPNNASGGIR